MRLMAGMNIKDPEVREAALRLAASRGISMTEAVRQALEEAVARDRQNDPHFVERLLTIGREARLKMDRLGMTPLTDDDLYDENGLPR